MIGLPFCLLDPDWYHFRSRVREQKNHKPLGDKNGWYHITVMHRGESILYTDMNGSTYATVGVVPPCFVAASSIQKWNWTWKMSEAQRQIVLERVVRYFEGMEQSCKVVD